MAKPADQLATTTFEHCRKIFFFRKGISLIICHFSLIIRWCHNSAKIIFLLSTIFLITWLVVWISIQLSFRYRTGKNKTMDDVQNLLIDASVPPSPMLYRNPPIDTRTGCSRCEKKNYFCIFVLLALILSALALIAVSHGLWNSVFLLLISYLPSVFLALDKKWNRRSSSDGFDYSESAGWQAQSNEIPASWLEWDVNYPAIWWKWRVVGESTWNFNWSLTSKSQLQPQLVWQH